jgi:pimeloyl-ACP methyl ester carboxylesterase
MSLLPSSVLLSALLAAAPVALPIQEGLVDTGGVLIYYKTVGQGDPLVIVHGGPGASHDYLLPNVYTLARGHKLVFIDERGSGRSPRLPDPTQYTVENTAASRSSATPTAGSWPRPTRSSTSRTSPTSSWAARSPAPRPSTRRWRA